MDTSNITSNQTNKNSTIKLSTNYYQTRTARRAQHTQETHNLDTGTTTRTQQSVYSNFDTEHNIEKLYLASRNNTNNNAHQNLACTFDLSDKICTVCTTPHYILSQTQQSPLTFVISDQGFLGILSGGGRALHQNCPDRRRHGGGAVRPVLGNVSEYSPAQQQNFTPRFRH